MHQHPPPLVQLGLDEVYRRQKVREDVGILGVVHQDLVANERLEHQLSVRAPMWHEMGRTWWMLIRPRIAVRIL